MAGVEEDWQGRIRSIAEGLLTLEINTIEKDNMLASKMPDMPMALHQIVRLYADKLAGWNCFITDDLLDLAQKRFEPGPDFGKDDKLKAWSPGQGDERSDRITNGPRTFEALRWVAGAALKQLDTYGDSRLAEVAIVRTTVSRIIINSLQLREVSLLLLDDHKKLPNIGPDNAKALFDGTIDETTRALFKQPRPLLTIDTDVLVLVRKVWDIGLERVLFQTAMQVDGDVLVRVAPDMDPDKREFFAKLHRATVETGLSQWKGLFELAGTLISGVGRVLFGRVG